MAAETPAYQQAKTYHAQEDRRMLSRGFVQAGVVAGGDLKVTTGGSGLQLAIAAGDAWVKGSHAGVTRQGVYSVFDSGGTLTLDAAHATLPRIDRIYQQITDTEPAPGVAGDASSQGQLVKVTGTATSGVTLNAPGASPGAAPASSLLLADILVPAAFTGPFVNNTHIRDRRPAAFGAAYETVYTGGNLGLTTTEQTFFAIRKEISASSISAGNAQVFVHVRGEVLMGTTATFVNIRPSVDGVTAIYGFHQHSIPASAIHIIDVIMPVTVAVGSRVFGVALQLGATSTGAVLEGTATLPFWFGVYEAPYPLGYLVDNSGA